MANMYRVALRMLFFDRPKYIGLVLGIAFSTLLINQQVSIFLGLISRAGSIVDDVPEADVWVMDPGVKNLDTVFPMRDTELGRVRGVQGVLWSVPFLKSNATVRAGSGELESVLIVGVDDSSLIGLPPKFLLGEPEDLRRPNAVAMGVDGYSKIWPDDPLVLGKTVEVNDRRAVVVALVRDSPKFTSGITFFTRYSQALEYTNSGRNQLSFLLVRSGGGERPEVVAERIKSQTGLLALTSSEFRRRGVMYVVQNTGIPVSFGTVIVLGVLVGVSVVGLMLHLFVIENLRHFATLKAIGVKNIRLLKMVFVQASVVGFVGFAFGLGGAAIFFEFAGRDPNFAGFFLPWEVAMASGFIAMVIMWLASFLALRRVLVIEPAIVFRG